MNVTQCSFYRSHESINVWLGIPPTYIWRTGNRLFWLNTIADREKVKVMFVVPRLFPDQEKIKSFLINANAIAEGLVPKGTNKGRRRSRGRVEERYTAEFTPEKIQSGFDYVHVPAGISPYNDEQRFPLGSEITSWNYKLVKSMQTRHHEEGVNTEPGDDGRAQSSQQPPASLISGTYGKNLMDEIYRYAEVGKEIARQNSFDVIHAHDWMTFPAGIAAKRVSRKPLVVHVHSTEVDRAGEHVSKNIFEIEHLGLHYADHVITVSNWTKCIVMARYNIPEEKIKVIHNGHRTKGMVGGFFLSGNRLSFCDVPGSSHLPEGSEIFC